MRRTLSILSLIAVFSGLSLTRPFLFSPSDKNRELVSPPRSIVYFTFGYREALADLFWIRSIQDFDYCEKPLAKNHCLGNGWLFRTLDLVTELSPFFRMAYSAGGMALTIIVSDYEGASKLFDKAVFRFPHDWIILYKAAYHALYEEKDKAKAAKLMEMSAANGAPDWVFSLASKLYTDSGQREVAIRLIEELEKTEFDKNLIEAMRKKLAQ